MLRNRLFNILIAAVLLLVVAVTAREALATSISTSHVESQVTCSSLPSRYSIHTEKSGKTGTLVIFTEDGPTGVDDGFIRLMSAYRTCSR